MARRRTQKRCPHGMRVQSYLFPKDGFTVTTARSWLKKHGGGKPVTVGKQKNFIRISVIPKQRCRTAGPWAVKRFGTHGVKGVLCCPK